MHVLACAHTRMRDLGNLRRDIIAAPVSRLPDPAFDPAFEHHYGGSLFQNPDMVHVEMMHHQARRDVHIKRMGMDTPQRAFIQQHPRPFDHFLSDEPFGMLNVACYCGWRMQEAQEG